mmetsp:Transcript_16528/g.24445  ORF Transcript_16528/g.24445 Transcript_16528/m.24445 type:complete len:93 (-) Transcript_16528:718-996(-)
MLFSTASESIMAPRMFVGTGLPPRGATATGGEEGDDEGKSKEDGDAVVTTGDRDGAKIIVGSLTGGMDGWGVTITTGNMEDSGGADGAVVME